MSAAVDEGLTDGVVELPAGAGGGGAEGGVGEVAHATAEVAGLHGVQEDAGGAAEEPEHDGEAGKFDGAWQSAAGGQFQ